MSEEFYTVEAAAERLKLHPKTVLRFIHEGRLRATRVGRQYRILRSDLAALAGAPAAPSGARVTSIVDIPGAGGDLARRLAAYLPALRTGEAHADPMSIDLAHDPARDHLKIVVVGAPGDVAAMLGMIDIWLRDRP